MLNDSMCDEDHKSAYHEAGHIVFAKLMDIPISCATIKDLFNRAKTIESMTWKIKLFFPQFFKIDPKSCVIYFRSGGMVQEYFCKDSERHPCDEKEIMSCGNNQEIKIAAEKYITEKLSDPKIRWQIEDVASVLLDKQYHYYRELDEVIKNANRIK